MTGVQTCALPICLIGGALGDSFQGSPPEQPDFSDDFIEEIELSGHGSGKEYAEGVKPISNGIVIDHILRGEQEKEIRDHLPLIIKVLKLYGKGGEWVSDSRDNPGTHKGIIFRPGHPPLDEHDIKKLAAIAPGCTLNVIDQKRVVKKVRLKIPPRIYGFDEISCKNENCSSHPDHFEGVPAEFYRTEGDRFICKYCEKMHSFKKIWT